MKWPWGLVFFDVDSTLVSIEGIDELAAGNRDIAALTEQAMNGQIALEEVYGRRLEIVKPTTSDIEALSEKYLQALLPDVVDVVQKLKERGTDVHLVSAGIEQAIIPLLERLSLPRRALHAVRVDFHDDGSYRDYDRRSPLTRSGGKEVAITNVRVRTKGKAAMVGDGASDLEAKPAVDLFIGFGGVQRRENVRAGADVYVEEPRLTSILNILEEYA